MSERQQGIAREIPQEEVFRVLARTSCLLAREFERLCRKYGLTSAQYNALRILREAGRTGIICSEVGERLMNEEPDVTRLLDRMEKRGWVLRKRGEKDRRSVLVRIMPEGRKLAGRLEGPVNRLYRDLLSTLTPRDLRQIVRILGKLRG